MRYVLIDFNHLAYKTFGLPQFSADVDIDGKKVLVDTTIPNYTIKNVLSYSRVDDINAMIGVCLEGGSVRRKAHFLAGYQNENGVIEPVEYKGNREKSSSSFRTGINLAIAKMIEGKVSLYRSSGLEADDMIASLVRLIKSIDQRTPIDIITNDADLLPYVDNQVSVFIRSKVTKATRPSLERRGYYQVTPETWSAFLKTTGEYKDFVIPYNSMLLYKMIRGDSSDNIPASVKKFGKVTYNKVMDVMIEQGVDFPNIFRYGVNFNEVIEPVLLQYFSEDAVKRMEWVYRGMDHDIIDLALPKQISFPDLQNAVSQLRINLPFKP